MLRPCYAVALASVVFCLAAKANATPFDLGTFSGSGSAGLSDAGLNGSFSDFYDFSLSSPSSYNLQLVGFDLSSVNVSLYSGTYDPQTPLPATPIFTTGSTTFPVSSVGQHATLSSGSYFFDISGSGTSSQSFYGGGIAVSAVPLPPAVGLFGAGLAGLFSYGYWSRRRMRQLA